jgi:exopolysaccharide biosynthesis polyprenyl glycosylphosphotransferase
MCKEFPQFYRFILLVADLLFVFAGLSYAIVLNSLFKSLPQQNILDYAKLIPVIAIAASILIVMNGLISVARMFATQVIISVGLTVFQLMLVAMTASFLFNEPLSRTALLLAAILQFILLSLWKYAMWRFERSRLPSEVVLILGTDCLLQRIVERLQNNRYHNYVIRNLILNESVSEEMWRAEIAGADLLILESSLPIAVREIAVRLAQNEGKRVSLIPDYYEMFCLNTEFEQIDDIPLFTSKCLVPSMETLLLKAGLDFTVSIAVLFLIWPVLALVAAAIWLEDRGPVIYSQIRVGKDEREFGIYKFRSMRKGAEDQSGPVLATENDARNTRVGRFIRTYRIDELPQFINVLRGEMSIVGPRPERPFFVEQLKQSLPGYSFRHHVKPGISGFAQVFAKYTTEPRDKLVYDLIYIQKCSLLTDLTVMLKTVRVLLAKASSAGVKLDGVPACNKLQK